MDCLQKCGNTVNPLSLISTIVDRANLFSTFSSQSSFFNFYYCRFYCYDWTKNVNPLSLISTIVDCLRDSVKSVVNPLSLISTIVDFTRQHSRVKVNPLSLISTIVDLL